jgi:hypothetical protein
MTGRYGPIRASADGTACEVFVGGRTRGYRADRPPRHTLEERP